ncbi:TerD family protein [Acinetobacter sp. ABJ-A23_2]|uniref:TerD family protein n=1 Tax=Acinetobacter sp. ABJ-A23_2 TaxID=3376991 RepID=UPI0037C982FC
MAISLNKGGNLSLSKADPNLVRVLIGLGWDERATDGAAFDLDASAFLLTANGKVRGDHDFIFYNQLKSQDGAVEHTGDNRSGQGDGDDETLLVNLAKVAPEVEKIAITVTIHDAQARGQNFGQIANAFIRVVNQDTNVEVVRFDLAEDYSTETAMVFGEVYRHNGEWKFKAVGQGYSGGLAAMCQQYGIQVG